MRKPRLGILNSSSMDKSYGGIAPFITNLDPFFQEAFEVHYIVLPDAIYDIQFIPRRFSFVIFLLFSRKRMARMDILLSHTSEGSYVASFGKVPFVHIFHGNFNPMSQSRYWYGKYFIPVFEMMERRIIKKATLKYTVGSERPSIPKIFNPIRHQVKIKGYDERSGFIFSGRLEKIKNIDRIIAIYCSLPEDIQRHHTLYIAGTGTQEGLLKALAASKNPAGQICFLGNLRNSDLIEISSSKKILLMASSQEGFPMAIAEAFSLGVPVISTDTGDIARMLKSNENGFLYPLSFSDEDYICGIKTILKEYDRFATAALASAENFKAENVASTLISDMLKSAANK